jgi:hypothetical protein
MFYKTTVQAVLLFGSESWTLSPVTLRQLEGFHLRAAYRMAIRHKPERGPNGTWKYPATVDVLEEVGLRTAEEYIAVRRQTIAAYVVNRPVFWACVEGERMRGTVPHTWWWEQPMDLDAAREASASIVAADNGD